mmetsp:Transcript_9625/g.22391  ORF Transcript_9625/g.22391 Transcript_9625/m.22391 type:complete len:286 (+) Transcript_9625:1897-2754(+)
MLHDLAPGAEGRQRHAAADDLAKDGDVRREAGDQRGVMALGRGQADAEAGHHLVQHQQRAMLCAQPAQGRHEGHGGAHEVHVAGDGLDDDAGQLLAMLGESGLQLLDVVVFEDDRVGRRAGRDAGAGRVAEGGQARASFHEQRVGVAVVAALELDELGPAGGAAGQADGAHRRFGARADEAHLVDAGHQLQDLFGQLDLALGGRAEGEALGRSLLHGLPHRRVAVAEDHRAPGADVVDVALPFGVPDIGPLAPGDEAGRAADGAESAHRRVDAARNHACRAFKQL